MAQRILIVDDDPCALEGLRALLMAWGYEADTAPDGLAALEKIAAVQPAAVITDIAMPVMSGLDLLGALRIMRSAPPVIVISAQSHLETLLLATAAGAFAYLQKPVDVAKLKAVLLGALTEATWETTVP